MTANSRRNPPEKGVNFAFAVGLLIGIAIGLLATRPSTPARIDRRARNEAILREVANEVVHD